MPELISNPQPEPGMRSTDPSGHVAHPGLDGLQHAGFVVRYDAATDPSEQPDDAVAGDGEEPGTDVEEAGPDTPSGTGSAGRIRAILGALMHRLLVASWACLHLAYRYPRWALVIGLSVVILGATALTRPGNPTPTAEIRPEKAAGSQASRDDKKAPEDGEKEPKPDPAALAKSGSAPPARGEEGKPDGKGKKEPTVAAPPTETVAAPAPSAPEGAETGPPRTTATVADAGPGPGRPSAEERSAPAITPPSAEKETVPAPAPPSNPNVASLLGEPSSGHAPAPAPPTPAPSESSAAPATQAAGPPRTDSDLPLLPGPGPSAAPAAAQVAATPSPTSGPSNGLDALPPVGEMKPASAPGNPGQPAGSGPPTLGQEVKLTGGASPGNTPPPSMPPHDSTAGIAGTGGPPPTSPSVGAIPQPSPSQPAEPGQGSSAPAAPPDAAPSSGPATPTPLPLVSAPPESLQPFTPVQKPELPAPAPVSIPKDESSKGESAHALSAVGPGTADHHEPPKAKADQPSPPEVKPEIPPSPPEVKSEAKAPELLPIGPSPESKATSPEGLPSVPETTARAANPGPGPEGRGLDAPRAGGAAETHKPNILKEEDLSPGPEERSTGSPGAAGRPGVTGRPDIAEPRDGDHASPKDQVKERVTIPVKPEEPPAATVATPASEPASSKLPEAAARDEDAGERASSSASGPSAPTTQPAREAAGGGWVRIPNKGRIPSDMVGDPDAFKADPRGSERTLDRRGRADEGVGFESASSPISRPDANDRAVAAPVSASTSPGFGTAVPSIRPAGRSRAGSGSSRVQPSLHIVEREENFWTISRLEYGSGRYYRALWKANSRKFPNINEIHVNDVIEIPPVEDLDPAYVERPQRRQVAGRDAGTASDLTDGPGAPTPAGMERPRSFPTTRTARTSDAGDRGPATRSGRAAPAPELDLPVGEADTAPARVARGSLANRSDAEEEGGSMTTIRSTARPRNTAPVDRPVYKVRRYDTLRSIARDILGDPRRSAELYDLNRDVIDDPTRLTAGQLLELPEDADTRRVTARDRDRGRD